MCWVKSKFYNNTSIAININSNQSISLQTYHFNLAVTQHDVSVVAHNGTFIIEKVTVGINSTYGADASVVVQ